MTGRANGDVAVGSTGPAPVDPGQPPRPGTAPEADGFEGVDAVAAGTDTGYDDSPMAEEAARVRDTVTVQSAGSDLPQVLHTAPAAVALIDLDAGTVTYANGSAQELTGGRATLPPPA
jgi:PAS domain-containing protein